MWRGIPGWGIWCYNLVHTRGGCYGDVMQSALRKIGNSTGIVLPRAILGQIGLTTGATLDLRVEDGVLIATPVKRTVREGWAEAAAVVGAAEQDPDEAAWMAFGNEGDDALTW